MSAHELGLLLSGVFGGLVLFLLGMQMMTEGLREAAGARLRGLLGRAARSRLRGLAFGTLAGTLAHSSAATAMLVGLVNAGLVAFAGAVPVILGANIGTTVSMQVIAFDLDAYWALAACVGGLLMVVPGSRRTRAAGRGILGFGLLFLGMGMMSGAVEPHRDLLVPWLAAVDGGTMSGLVLGIAVSTLVTGVIQSSGATIGVCYALVSAGAFTSLSQAFPIVLGAHIGTCATALLASIGAGPDARRVAFAHLLFNILNVAAAVVLAPVLLEVLPLTSSDLTRQIANTHTLIITGSALVLLPFSRPFASLVRALSPARHDGATEASHLDETLIATPERAICAILRELGRVARIAKDSLARNRQLMLEFRRRDLQAIRRQEDSIDEIKPATRDYLFAVTRRYLSRRQMILLQHLDRCVSELERVQDHVEALSAITAKHRRIAQNRLDGETLECLLSLVDAAHEVLEQVAASLDPDIEDFGPPARAILEAQKGYDQQSQQAKTLFASKVAEHEDTPGGALVFGEYIGTLDRIVRHAKVIALAESHPDFWIKRAKLDLQSPEDSVQPPPPPPDVDDLVARFHTDS